MDIQKILDECPDLQPHLFARGYYITDGEMPESGRFPFYKNWNDTKLGNFTFRVHKDNNLYSFIKAGKIYFLIGHAYNPFSMEIDEVKILERVAGSGDYTGALNELTGVFLTGIIEGGEITLCSDCSGMQYSCYYIYNSSHNSQSPTIHLASHMRIIGDLFNLPIDEYVKKLIKYPLYKRSMGNFLPGDITAFKDVKLLAVNCLTIINCGNAVIKRFYPAAPVKINETEKEYNETLKEAAGILTRSMLLAARKWRKPMISLTGGRDSNTTFAAAIAANQLKINKEQPAAGKFKWETFSYISIEREAADAEAAGKISQAFDIKHSIIKVPGRNEEIKDFEIYKAILTHNQGEIGGLDDADVRKKIILMQSGIKLEIKSWVQETIRLYAYRHHGLSKRIKKYRPRHWTAFYKVFLWNRLICRKTDRIFKEYFDKTQLKELIFNYDEADFYVWECMWGSWGALNLGVMKFCFDVDIIFNNRIYLDTMLRTPREKRFSDENIIDLQKLMSPEHAELGIYTPNANETKRRARLARILYKFNTLSFKKKSMN